MNLSIVIPVYNEINKITGDIKDASTFLTDQKIQGEIIVVDDGSTDHTSTVARKAGESESIHVKIIECQYHRGKGHAVKSGILEAVSEFVLFIDSGSCIPYSDILKGIEMIRENICDISHGSRNLPESRIIRPRNYYRKITSSLFRKFVQWYMHIPVNITDSQCGLKIYRREISHELYSECVTEGFMFDLEIILRALRKGYRIKEFPVEWTSDPDSRLSFFKTLVSLFPELRRIKKILAG